MKHMSALCSLTHYSKSLTSVSCYDTNSPLMICNGKGQFAARGSLWIVVTLNVTNMKRQASCLAARSRNVLRR